MKGGFAVKLRNVFMYITLIWSAVMAAVYLLVLFELPVFELISYLPLGEYFCEFLTLVLLAGIWIVPVLYVITISLMIFVREKQKEDSMSKKISVSVILLPLCLTALMLLTNFTELLA